MAGTSTTPDDLEAVRAVVDALKPFTAEDQRRILRWAQEKLGLATALASPLSTTMPVSAPGVESHSVKSPATARDIRFFLQEKRPASDVQFAAAVAYYFAFEAPEAARKDEIAADDLKESARLSARAHLRNPTQTLHDAARLGYLDKGSGRGTFRISTVGENLVTMAMPHCVAGDVPARKRPRRKPAAR